MGRFAQVNFSSKKRDTGLPNLVGDAFQQKIQENQAAKASVFSSVPSQGIDAEVAAREITPESQPIRTADEFERRAREIISAPLRRQAGIAARGIERGERARGAQQRQLERLQEVFPPIRETVAGVGKGISKVSEVFDPLLERATQDPRAIIEGVRSGEITKPEDIVGRIPATTEELFEDIKTSGGGELLGQLIGNLPALIAGGTGAKVARGTLLKLFPQLAKGTGFLGAVGKAALGAAEGAAATTGFEAAQLRVPEAEDVATGAVLGAAFEQAIPVIQGVVRFLKTPRGAKEIVKANEQTFKAIKPRLTKKRNLSKVKQNLATANEEIVSHGFAPKNLEEYNDAIKQTKSSIWDDLERQLREGGETGLEVDVQPIVDAIRKRAQSSSLLRTNAAAAKQLDNFADDLISQGRRVNVLDAEDTKQLLNAEVGGLFGEINLSQQLKEAKKLATRMIGQQLDDVLAKGAKGQFQGLKNKYGALRDIEEDVFKRSIVFNRQNPVNLIQQFGRVGGLARSVGAAFKGDFAQFTRGLGEVFLPEFIKRANDANRIVGKAFATLAKNIRKVPPPPAGALRGQKLLPGPSGKQLTRQEAIALPEAGALQKTEKALTGQIGKPRRSIADLTDDDIANLPEVELDALLAQ